MANVTTAFGLRPVGHFLSGSYNGQHEVCYVPSTYGTALFIGDPVIVTGTSNASRVITGSSQYASGRLREVNLATAGGGNAISGVVIGFDVQPNDLETIYGKADTERVAQVITDPYVIYEVRDDGSGTPAAGFVGANANLVSGTGVASTGFSGWSLDATTPAATQNFQVKVLNFIDRVDNEVGDYAVYHVLINQHSYDQNTAGV